MLTTYRCTAQTFDRSRARIGRDGVDHITLQFCLSGKHGRRDGPAGSEAGPGDMFIADLAQSQATGTNEFDSLNVTIPRRLLAPLLKAPSRAVGFTGFSDALAAEYDAGTFQAFGELGYRIDTAFVALEPFANLAYVSLSADEFSEQGGAAALAGTSSDTDTSFTTLGLRASKTVLIGNAETTLRGTLGWRHAFGDIVPLATQAFAGSEAFTVAGTPIAEDAALIEAGFDVLVGASTTLGVAYTGQFGDGVTQNGFNATLKMAF